MHVPIDVHMNLLTLQFVNINVQANVGVNILDDMMNNMPVQKHEGIIQRGNDERVFCMSGIHASYSLLPAPEGPVEF